MATVHGMPVMSLSPVSAWLLMFPSWATGTGGSGKDDIGVKRGNRWFLDYNNTGAWDTGDITYNNFGLSSDLPVAGDWNADGYDEIGVKRGTRVVPWITMAPVPGMPGDVTYNNFGLYSDLPVAGGWNADGYGENRGEARKQMVPWTTMAQGPGTPAITPPASFGLASDLPVVSKWAP